MASGLLSIIALCNSLGLYNGIAGAACIRRDYVKLLGVIFYGAVFCLCGWDAALPDSFGVSDGIVRLIGMCCMKRRLQKL